MDYSAAKVFGAAETPAQFKVAFDGINRLFITEAKKYDVSKKLKVRVNEISLDAVNQVNEAIDPQELMTTNASYMLSEDQIKQIVNALPTQKKPGIGLVIIAKLLNKAEAYGSYQVVFFNTETKEIIQDWATGGKARGFGRAVRFEISAFAERVMNGRKSVAGAGGEELALFSAVLFRIRI